MNSLIKEMYEVAKSFVSGSEECSAEQFEDALSSVIEMIEDGEYNAAIEVGMVY